jgi:hypothetical protein
VADRNPLAAVAHGHTLAEAIVDTVREPLVVLDRDLRVIAASRSFYRTFAVEPRNTQGRKLYLLGDGQWNIPALRTVLEDVIPKHRTVEAYEVEHEFPTIGRRVMLLNARQVFDEDGSATALLLAIEDVTQRRDTEREKDDLLRQKEILLQEMQHRVANSLQIIASILLLKARTVQSEEIRLHLEDAHQSRSARPVKSWLATTLGSLAGPYRYRTMARDLETRLPKGHTPVSARALLKRWPVNSTPRCRNPVARRGRPSQLLQAQQRKAPSGRNRFYPRWPVAGSKSLIITA